MAKQTFTTGQVLTAAQMNSLQSNDFNQTVSVKTASYTLVAADKGTRIEFNTSGSVTCTVNTGLFDAGDTVVIQNRGAGDVTVTAGTATVNTAGSLVISQYQSANLYFISASASILFAGAVGDLTAVTSGTGISISNAGGPIPTITNSMATEITASGDIVVGTGNGTFDNLPIGTTGQVLTADTTVSPYKVKWASPSAASFVGASVKKTVAQVIANNTYVKVNFAAEFYDTDGFHDNSTNNTRLTIPSGKAGKYLLTAKAELEASNTTGIRQMLFYKNNNIIFYQAAPASATLRFASDQTYVFDAAVGDYFELALYQSSGINLDAYEGDYGNIFAITYLGA